ncbi:MAG: TylF/MycF/NovP-related O-methyltransferase [Alkalispirochaeta sp.]
MPHRSIPVRVYPPGYGDTAPVADYRPWSGDLPFLRVWERIRDRTLLDQSRLYELWELLPQIAPIPGAILEVGTWRGGSAALLALRSAEFFPERTVYVADTFSGVAKAGPRDPYYAGGEHADTALDTVDLFLHSLDLRNYSLLEGIFPEETAHRVHDRKIAFCHVDVDVYESAKGVFEWVWPRVPLGGLIVFDDYGFYGCEGVTTLVHELRRRTDLVAIANLNGHAVFVRTQERTTTL